MSQPRGRGGRPPRPTPHLPTAPSLEVNPAPRPAVQGTFLPQTLAFKSLSQLSEGRLPSPGWTGLPHPFCLVKSHLEGANWWCVLFPRYFCNFNYQDLKTKRYHIKIRPPLLLLQSYPYWSSSFLWILAYCDPPLLPPAGEGSRVVSAPRGSPLGDVAAGQCPSGWGKVSGPPPASPPAAACSTRHPASW